MDREYPAEAWKRLGKALEARRGQLGYGFRQRENFLADRGGPPPSLKMLARLERGELTSYPPATIASLESLYELIPGSFEASLEGGDLKPLRTGPPLQPRDPSAADQHGEPEDDPAWDLFPDPADKLLRWIWRMPVPVEDREQLVADSRARRRRAAQEPPGRESACLPGTDGGPG